MKLGKHMILDQTLSLNNGVKIPQMALGTWLLDDAAAKQAVSEALALGYRHIDTDQAYGNETGVGEGIRKAGVKREDVFVTTKVAAEHKDYDSVKESIDDSLSRLGLDYLDLLIIHSPQPWAEVNKSTNRYFEGNLAAWSAMEDALKAGKVRAIGVSNFLEADLENILSHSSTVPAVNQILAHIGNTPLKLIDYCKRHDITVEAYSPVGHGAVLNQPQIKQMAAKYGVSPAQLCLRYDWQLGMVILPKTANPEHMKQNADLAFEISPADMASLEKIVDKDYGDASYFPVYGGKL